MLLNCLLYLRAKGSYIRGDALTLFNRKVLPLTCFGAANGITFEQLFTAIKSSAYNNWSNMKPATSATFVNTLSCRFHEAIKKQI